MSKLPVEVAQLEPFCIRPKEAARLIGVSDRTFATLRSCGKLPPSYKLNGCVVYKVADIRLWVDSGFPTLDKFLELKEVEDERKK